MCVWVLVFFLALLRVSYVQNSSVYFWRIRIFSYHSSYQHEIDRYFYLIHNLYSNLWSLLQHLSPSNIGFSLGPGITFNHHVCLASYNLESGRTQEGEPQPSGRETRLNPSVCDRETGDTGALKRHREEWGMLVTTSDRLSSLPHSSSSPSARGSPYLPPIL